MNADFLLSIFKQKAINEYSCRIKHGEKERYRFYGNRDLNRLSKKAFDNGQDVFYAKHIKPESERFADRYELSDPIYVYHLKRDLTEEEFDALLTAVNHDEESNEYVMHILPEEYTALVEQLKRQVDAEILGDLEEPGESTATSATNRNIDDAMQAMIMAKRLYPHIDDETAKDIAEYASIGKKKN